MEEQIAKLTNEVGVLIGFVVFTTVMVIYLFIVELIKDTSLTKNTKKIYSKADILSVLSKERFVPSWCYYNEYYSDEEYKEAVAEKFKFSDLNDKAIAKLVDYTTKNFIVYNSEIIIQVLYNVSKEVTTHRSITVNSATIEELIIEAADRGFLYRECEILKNKFNINN